MRGANPIVFSGIAPHPPIMVPEVGREAISEVLGSIEAMAEFTRRIINAGARTVVLISPHAPLERNSFVAYQSSTLYGSFANFRAPEAHVEFELDRELLTAITTAAGEEGYSVTELDERYELDHGSAVPLYFLQRNGWKGRAVVLGYSFLSNENHEKFGGCIKRAVAEVNVPTAFVASGDLSHRLKPEAPAGFNPIAKNFDEQVVAAIRDHAPQSIAEIDPDLRRLAGECGYRSMLVALGASGGAPEACEVLHYEAPFGVGYLVAQLTNAQHPTAGALTEQKTEDVLPALAREAVETFVRSGKQISPPAGNELLTARAACFVSLKTRAGDLRGCIGTIEPAKQSLAEELIANAINAATRDPRFAPVGEDELQALVYSVDVLEAPEAATFAELDPAIYGVIVEDEPGIARGLLLPSIEGVDTAQKQVDIAARKAGIPPGTPLKFQRFKVTRYREQ
ncbi:MAG TPA: AmmeMemoRadiSam system protein A [Pyrinomonadaceae bacterium]|nr:AmmeMemoRadiSam system protein A [Pyrinomonadaceae bacterium]